MLNPVVFQNLWFKTRGTRTVQPKTVPSSSQSFLTGHCRATAALQLQRDPACQRPFTAQTRVQIPPGTPNLFKNLRERRQFCAGTKRNIGNNYPIKVPCNVHVCKGLPVLVRGYKRHTSSIRLPRSVFPAYGSTRRRHFELCASVT
jgi:hypothetical protein